MKKLPTPSPSEEGSQNNNFPPWEGKGWVNEVSFRDMGRIAYSEAWDLQEKLLKENVDLKLETYRDRGRDITPESIATQHHLLFCEHNPVYTIGKSGKKDHLLLNETGLAAKGIEFFTINRGGDITFHGPGQITGYPIFDLERFKPDIHWYLRTLEEAVIQLLTGYGLKGERSEGETGVWLDVGTPQARKICAIGVRCSRWITMHGFALNVSTDLDYFRHIIPCGIHDKAVTSLEQEIGQKPDFEGVKEELRGCLSGKFGFHEI
jgi:lipoyl(octanoyl) transferase